MGVEQLPGTEDKAKANFFLTGQIGDLLGDFATGLEDEDGLLEAGFGSIRLAAVRAPFRRHGTLPARFPDGTQRVFAGSPRSGLADDVEEGEV